MVLAVALAIGSSTLTGFCMGAANHGSSSCAWCMKTSGVADCRNSLRVALNNGAIKCQYLLPMTNIGCAQSAC